MLQPGPLKAKYKHPAPDRGGADLLGDAVDKDVEVNYEDAEDEASSEDEIVPAEQVRKKRVLVEASRRRKRHKGDGETTDPDVLALLPVGLARRGRLGMAAWVIFGFGASLRPSQNLGLRQCDLIPPGSGEGQPRSYLAFMSAVFGVLRGSGTTQRVWSFDYAELANFVPYELRHAGPSWERLLHLRTLAEVQMRGRWKTLKSVMRYEEAVRL